MFAENYLATISGHAVDLDLSHIYVGKLEGDMSYTIWGFILVISAIREFLWYLILPS